mmetsp:Transcript_43585/g.114563  ORF Transcript_43585/g.114563 Transcript_43585/m.114563 type:complete len:185 (+) Transcript_43585:55-609(+)
MATDYRKWDNIDVSSDEEEAQQSPPATKVKPTPPADAAAIIERLERAERLGEEVLAERQQMVELDRQRNKNREALAALRHLDRDAEKAGLQAPEAHWMCTGDLFVKRSAATTRQMLEEEQKQIDSQLETLRASVKRKTSTLCELDPSITGGSNIHRSFRDLHGMSASELERQAEITAQGSEIFE